jgi:hypothetical protein
VEFLYSRQMSTKLTARQLFALEQDLGKAYININAN